jgi:hypothetical protein
MTVSSFSGWFKTAFALVVAAVLAVGAGAVAAYADDTGPSICSVTHAESLPVPATTPFDSTPEAGCREVPDQRPSAHMGGM